jgi:hypothetical protein
LFALLSALTQLLSSRVMLRGALCGCLLLLSLTRLLRLAALFLFLLLRGAARCLFGLPLVALFLILLTSFFSAAAATLRVRKIGNSQHYRQRKDSRGCEASIINFHGFSLRIKAVFPRRVLSKEHLATVVPVRKTPVFRQLSTGHETI